MTGERATRCQRTRGLIDRVVGEAVTAEDRAHAPGCPTCGPVLARAATFDDELRRTARKLVAEELPRGILDPSFSGQPDVRARRPAPGLAGIMAAVAVLVLATGVALFPGGLTQPSAPPSGPPVATGPAPTPEDTGLQMGAPALARTSRFGGSLYGLGWLCGPPAPLASVPTGLSEVDHEGIRCPSPAKTPSVSVVAATRETVDNEVVEISMEGEQLGPDSDSTRRAVADLMAKATMVAFYDERLGTEAADFVSAELPKLELLVTGDDVTEVFGSVRLLIQRAADGTYFLLLQALPG